MWPEQKSAIEFAKYEVAERRHQAVKDAPRLDGDSSIIATIHSRFSLWPQLLKRDADFINLTSSLIMRLSLLPPDLLGVLLASTALNAYYTHAGPAVNVALQASFNAPPYILELLLVTY